MEAKGNKVPDDPDRQWSLLVRESFRLHMPLRDDHAWTAIAREPLASQWEGPELGKSFPASSEFARAVLVSVVERGPQTLKAWVGAKGNEREQLAEDVALRSQTKALLDRGQRPVTDDEQRAIMRAATALATIVLDQLANHL
jgi:hypothetical protein